MPPEPPNRVRKSTYAGQQMYATWADPKTDGGESFAKASEAYSKAVISTEIERSNATNIFKNIQPGNISIKEGFNRPDYEIFRPGEQIPRRPKDIIAACQSAYDHIGLVKNVVDLMADFCVQGINVVHQNPTIEKFYKQWWIKVDGAARSERFMNNFYRTGNVIVKRTLAKLKQKDRDNLQSGYAAIDGETDVKPPHPVTPGKIPWKYVFLNPLLIEVSMEELAPFIGDDGYAYSINVSNSVVNSFKKAKVKGDSALLGKIPSNIQTMLMNGKKQIPLPADQIESAYYKKDDWESWAKPMTFCILTDLKMYEKMKLADISALDGALSHVRLWKLGNMEHKLVPTDAAVNRLADMLLNAVPGGVMDLIWGPDLELHESSTDVFRFLGEMKYTPVLNAIYAGLGIPPTLTGSATQSGFTNNFISLRTLTERLNYGRAALIEFWRKELVLVQRAFNFRFPADLIFDRPTLTDEAAEKALLVQLADRDLISQETLQDRFEMNAKLERVRIKREGQMRDSGKMPPKAGAFHDPQHEEALQKIALQSGVSSPGQVGLTQMPKVPGEKSALEMKVATSGPGKQGKRPGVSGQGRPRNSKDSSKRKTKRVTPRSSAQVLADINMTTAWARDAQRTINDVLSPAYLSASSKTSIRQLNDKENEELENLKFAALSSFEPSDEVSEASVIEKMNTQICIPDQVQQMYGGWLKSFEGRFSRKPTLEESRLLQASVYSHWCSYVEEETLSEESEIDERNPSEDGYPDEAV